MTDPRGTTLSCSICQIRKEKRFCPAVHGRICPQCCGEQREVTLACPSDCPYLQQARQHERNRHIEELDRDSLMPSVEVDDQFLYEHEHLVVGLSFALARSVRANPRLVDRDLIATLTAMAKSYETLVKSNLIYGETSANLAHQALVKEVETMIKEYRDVEHKHLGYARLRDSEVLKALVFVLRIGLSRSNGRPQSRAFVDFLVRQFPEQEAGLSTPDESASRIIVP